MSDSPETDALWKGWHVADTSDNERIHQMADHASSLERSRDELAARLAEADAILEDAAKMLHSDAKLNMPTLPSAVAWSRNEIDVLRQRAEAAEAALKAAREENMTLRGRLIDLEQK